MDLKAYRDDVVRHLIERGDTRSPVPGFMAWAAMQGIVTDAEEIDAPFLWVCPRRRNVFVGTKAYPTTEVENGLVRIGDFDLRYHTKKGGSALVTLLVKTRSVPRPIDLWERWARACDVVVASAIRALGTRAVSGMELLACIGAAYGQSPDLSDPHEITALRSAFHAAKSRLLVEALWWIDMPTSTVYVYDGELRYKHLLLRNRGSQIYMWPTLDLHQSATVTANNHVAKVFGLKRIVPYVPYDRLLTFLHHVPKRFLPPVLHETTRVHAWRGIKRDFIDSDIVPFSLSFAGDLTIPARVPVSDNDTFYFHAAITMPSSSNGQLVFGIAETTGDVQSLSCDHVLHRQPGVWSTYEGAGWEIRGISHVMRLPGFVFMEMGILLHEKRTFALCANGDYGIARIRIKWAIAGKTVETITSIAKSDKLLFGAHERPQDGRYAVFAR